MDLIDIAISKKISGGGGGGGESTLSEEDILTSLCDAGILKCYGSDSALFTADNNKTIYII